jgi:pimeloyl-ACP methyl ester carboxylesterase
MATAVLDGISTRYEVIGSGPPLLMYAPGGFDATVEKWSTLGIYARIKLLDYLPKRFTCIAFDRRECGQSAGRVEPIGWQTYVAQGKALLDHLKIDRAHLIGGCMGVSCVIAFAVAHPRRVASQILWWPVGGAKYRMKGEQRFAEHLAFVKANGLRAVVDLVRQEGKPFGADPRGGPWASVIKRDEAFAVDYAKRDRDIDVYESIVKRTMAALLDRDTAPGADPGELMKLALPTYIVPGRDESHATSAARYLEECIANAEYWDVPVAGQTEEASAPRLIEFLEKASVAA